MKRPRARSRNYWEQVAVLMLGKKFQLPLDSLAIQGKIPCVFWKGFLVLHCRRRGRRRKKVTVIKRRKTQVSQTIIDLLMWIKMIPFSHFIKYIIRSRHITWTEAWWLKAPVVLVESLILFVTVIMSTRVWSSNGTWFRFITYVVGEQIQSLWPHKDCICSQLLWVSNCSDVRL